MPKLKELNVGNRIRLCSAVSDVNIKELLCVCVKKKDEDDITGFLQSIEWRNVKSDYDILCAFTGIFGFIAKLNDPKLVSGANQVLKKQVLVNQIPQTLPRLIYNGRGDIIEQHFRRNSTFQSIMAKVSGDEKNTEFWERLKKVRLSKIDEDKDKTFKNVLKMLFQEDVDKIPSSERSADDMKFMRQGGGKLNGVHKVILSYCCSSYGFNSLPSYVDSYKSIFDFNKNEIATIKEQLPIVKKDLDINFIQRYLLHLCDHYNVNINMENDAQKKLTLGIFKVAIRDIEKLLKNYDETIGELAELRIGKDKELKKFGSIRSPELENTQEFVQKILSQFEELAKSGNSKGFEELAQMYGCATDKFGNLSIGFKQFNSFLREMDFKKSSVELYVYMFNQIDTLRKGLLKRSAPLNTKEFTLYRYTDLDGVLGMLVDSMHIDKNWEPALKKRLESEVKKEIAEKEAQLKVLTDGLGLSQSDDDKSTLELALRYNKITAKIADIRDRIRIYTEYCKKQNVEEETIKREIEKQGYFKELAELEEEKNQITEALDKSKLKIGSGFSESAMSKLAECKKLKKSIRSLKREIGVFGILPINKRYRNEVIKKIQEILKTNPVIYDRGFLSTSSHETATQNFGEFKFIITCKPGTVKAADISNLTCHRGQEEHLFVPNQLFKVTKYTTERKYGGLLYLTIYMETIKKKIQ